MTSPTPPRATAPLLAEELLAEELLAAGLLDDAAIFPPGDAAMTAALRSYRATRATPHGRYVASFVCTDTRLAELTACLPEDLDSLDLSLVVPGGISDVSHALWAAAQEPRLRVRAVELPGGATGASSLEVLLPQDVQGYLELPLDDRLPGAVHALAGNRHRIKLRTGGARASAFPSEDSLAAGLLACCRARVPFKLTAGLHNAARHRDPHTGFEHHGFLNVVVAVSSALQDGDGPRVAALLAERDGSALARQVADLSPQVVRAVREQFVSFGTCSTSEPLADLRALGLLPPVPSPAPRPPVPSLVPSRAPS